jgi:hypothetical protein
MGSHMENAQESNDACSALGERESLIPGYRL